ncbi:MAG: hypothetical protein AAF958_07590 [Planctomycetota bacterium]
MNSEHSALSIRQLLVTTTVIAIGLALVCQPSVPVVLKVLAIAACLYTSATCVFALSQSLKPPAREIIFLFGLPLYLLSVLAASITFVMMIAIAISLLSRI